MLKIKNDNVYKYCIKSIKIKEHLCSVYFEYSAYWLFFQYQYFWRDIEVADFSNFINMVLIPYGVGFYKIERKILKEDFALKKKIGIQETVPYEYNI